MKYKKKKYLFFRGNSLYGRMPLDGFPRQYSLNLHSTGTKADDKAVLELGEKVLAKLRVDSIEGRLFDIKKQAHDPKMWRIIGRYWYYHLRYKKSAKWAGSVRSPILYLLRDFGHLHLSALTVPFMRHWLAKDKQKKSKRNSINTVLGFLKRSLNYAVKDEHKEACRIESNPISKFSAGAGAVRGFVLTEELFERNYQWLQVHFPKTALFYLAGWLTGRRPGETTTFLWEQVQEKRYEDKTYYVISIQAEQTKKEFFDEIPIPRRLWQALLAQSDITWRERTGLIYITDDKGESWVGGEPGHFFYRWQDDFNKLKRIYKDAGVFRDTRRGFITHMTEILGYPEAYVKLLSGHKTYSSFNRYRVNKLKNILAISNPELFENSDQKDANLLQSRYAW